MRRDKAKVVDEIWDDARIESFLDRRAPASVDGDHYRLMLAYRSMREGDFRRFLALGVARGMALDAADAQGRTSADLIAGHRHGKPYVDALLAHGARAPAPAPTEAENS